MGSMEALTPSSRALERDKERMIRHYLELQDEADAVNEKIYNLCCEIEAMNLRIKEAKAAEEKARMMEAKSAQTPPLNGSGHRK